MAAEDACPVDHKARQAWLDKSRSSSTSDPSLPAQQQSASTKPSSTSTLGSTRETSSIPRLQNTNTTPSTESTHANPTDSSAGNWIYPSEQMFFDAMRRKNFDPETADMKSIVPIHNAVNERAWGEILKWERGKYPAVARSSSPAGVVPQKQNAGDESAHDVCLGPKLVSFSGLATAMTPKARLNTLLGYAPPFDRHDWIVDRCGTRIDYVIDFYAGKKESGTPLSFYLDVRPKLNTWEGCKTRALAWFGW